MLAVGLVFAAGVLAGRADFSRPETSPPVSGAPSTSERSPEAEDDVAAEPVAQDDQPSPVHGDEAFVETFDGDGGLERFRTGVYHRERDGFEPPHPQWVDTTPWPADHDIGLDDCGSPHEHHHLVSTADGDDASLYVCRDHLMTTMGNVSGYSVVWFSPDEIFDSVSEVCWAVNVSTEVLGHRQWWEVAITPADQPDENAISWLAGTANLPTYEQTGSVVLGFGPDNPPHPKISVGDTVVGRGGADDAEGRESVAIRRPHCFHDDGVGTLRYTSMNGDGTPYSFTAPGAFPEGPLKVLFKDHNYTPDKDCEHMPEGRCRSYTWHWDDIVIRR